MKVERTAYTASMPWYIKLRCWLIELLAGDMPIVLNMAIQRPPSFTGVLVSFPNPNLHGDFSHNLLWGGEMKGEALMLPKADFPTDIEERK
jgi:hypothetical protein